MMRNPNAGTQGRRWRRAWNIVVNARSPIYRREMAHKIKTRFTDHISPDEAASVQRWCGANAEDFETFAATHDQALLAEAKEFGDELSRRAVAALATTPYATKRRRTTYFPLLYFLTRLLRPSIVVETGVAAGYSSESFLQALKVNGGGRLLSSDLPLFRFSQPERFVGALVDPALREGWELHLDGDRRNLPKMVAGIHHVDLFHYDSDKTRSGRDFAVSLLAPKLGVLVMDDVSDNGWFRDYTVSTDKSWRVFQPAPGYFVGLVGL